MEQKSGWRLLSKRNVLGAVLLAGIAAGVYLGDLWKGFGGGSSIGVGIGDPATAPKTSQSGDETQEQAGTVASKDAAAVAESQDDATTSRTAPQVVKVVIADRSYFLRSASGDEATDLKRIVALATGAAGDEDGIKVRVYRRLSSRTATEIALRDALVAGGITDEQTVWVANPIDN